LSWWVHGVHLLGRLMRVSGLIVVPAALRTWCDSLQLQRRAVTKCGGGGDYNMLCAEKEEKK
jgi:hypothetical protein